MVVAGLVLAPLVREYADFRRAWGLGRLALAQRDRPRPPRRRDRRRRWRSPLAAWPYVQWGVTIAAALAAYSSRCARRGGRRARARLRPALGERRARGVERVPCATAPSRSTTGSGPVRSMTVEGAPGSSPASTTAPQPSRISPRDVVERAPVGLAVEVRARRRDDAQALEDRAAPPRSAGTRMPIASGVAPHSQRKRRAGFGSTSVYGPGRSARAATAARPRSLGHGVEDRVEVGGQQRQGMVSGRCLSRYSRRAGASR